MYYEYTNEKYHNQMMKYTNHASYTCSGLNTEHTSAYVCHKR